MEKSLSLNIENFSWWASTKSKGGISIDPKEKYVRKMYPVENGFHSMKGLTACHMPPGQFGTLAAKSLPHCVDVDLRLMCQMGFMQHQKPTHHW